MYLYELLCKACGNRFAKITGEKGAADVRCPECGSNGFRILQELYLSNEESDWNPCGGSIFG